MARDEDSYDDNEYGDREDEDEDIEEEEYDYEDEDDEYVPDETPEKKVSISPRMSGFLQDPWPSTAFIMIVIGFIIVLLTPIESWATWRYFLIANYGLIILGAAAIILSLRMWKNNPGSKLRFGGMGTLIATIFSMILGTIDTISLIIVGTGLIPLAETPLIAVCLLVVIFSLYTLWAVKRSVESPK